MELTLLELVCLVPVGVRMDRSIQGALAEINTSPHQLNCNGPAFTLADQIHRPSADRPKLPADGNGLINGARTLKNLLAKKEDRRAPKGELLGKVRMEREYNAALIDSGQPRQVNSE